MNIAFAGLRHDHIFDLYNLAKENNEINILGSFEENTEAKENAIKKGIICNYNSFEDLLLDETIETVVIGSCYSERGNMAIKALNAGKHVIADKPLCINISELDEIERLALKNNKKVSCMFTMRFEKKINALKRLIDNGALGEINNVYFGGQHPLQYGRRPMWYFEKGKHGGVINDIAIHGIDVLNYALGINANEILSARCWNKFAFNEPDFKDSAQFMLKADNNAGIIADVSYSIPDGIEFDLPYYWRFYIWGTKGTIAFSLNEEKSYYYTAGKKEPEILNEDIETVDYITDFLSMVKGNKTLLPMNDVFFATRKTLEIQEKSDMMI